MLRWLLSLMIALSFAAVAGAQDDDLDALLAGLGDDDPFADASVEAVEVVEVAEPAPAAEIDPFADLYAEPETISGEATASDAGFPEAAEEAAADFDDDAFADFFGDEPSTEPEAPAEVADAVVEDFGEDISGDMGEPVEDIWEASEAETLDGFGNDGFDDFFAEDIPEDIPAADEVAEAPAEEPEVPAEDFFEPVPETVAEAVAEAEAEIVTEQAVVEQIAAEAEASIPEAAEVATLDEGEAAAALIGQRVQPVEPAVKPADGKKAKKDKFSSEARKPIKSLEASEPVILDVPSEAPAAQPSRISSKTSSKGSWAEPVIW